jgi:hypothetical protein
MNYKDICYLGKKMPLRINKYVTGLLFDPVASGYNEEGIDLKKDDMVYFDAFVTYDHQEKRQYFRVRTENGKGYLIDQTYVDIAGSYTLLSECADYPRVKKVSEIKEGMTVMSIDPEVSEIGGGQHVTIICFDEIYSEEEALLKVKNQWGAEDFIGSHEIALLPFE